MDEKKVKIRHSLFFKLFLTFAFLVMLCALILGYIFMRLYSSATAESHKEDMLAQATKISRQMTEYIVNDDYENCLSYLQMLNDLNSTEVWTFSNPDALYPMSKEMESIMSDVELQEEYRDLIQIAFAGGKEYRTTFSKIHDCNIICLGVPIAGRNGQNAGALLLNTQLKVQATISSEGMKLIAQSTLIALIISFFAALFFAKKFSDPISAMRRTALRLAEGKYDVGTGLKRKDELGDLAKTIDFLSDKLQENEKERKNLDQMRMDFFANVSHELRTPITVVRAYTESLVDGVVEDEAKKQQYYERMLSECTSMQRLVGDLLTLSKMQNPDFQVEKEPVNLVQIFEDLERSAAALTKEKNIQIHLEKEADTYMMMGDYDRLRQMFLVILDNAIKFSKQGSEIAVRLYKGELLHVSIRDYGVGISKEELPNIFDKFYKSKLRQNAKGSGLGLTIAREIAMKHGGTIEVKSEQGKGTEFIFSFREARPEELEE
ncbi:MAG: HAMP domain-containing protein [Lachnospiraceae bacterium]|nr:HAMP domain-containing protein [Lachnospiraceae bacterium]